MPIIKNVSHRDPRPIEVQVEENGSTKELIAFQDNNGFILTKKEAVSMFEQLKKDIRAIHGIL
ncbi:hypothetical protein RWE15_11415 [Virgibacillus halophilus]|uniref:Uncharacterized protein n=1 Tax=Tigheibacillus halophilus TaxID=361280 RepID=A0ABU5C787_9BACI|nr:hypothetical protein [Virgibacillus halophilus]